MPQQVSVFLENRPGKVEQVTELLAAAGVNIRAVTIADSGDFGVLKLLVDDPARAWGALADGGLTAALKEVIAIRVPDRPGGLLEVARVLRKEEINVDDAYGFVLKDKREAVFVIQVGDPAPAAGVLTRAGLELLTEKDLYQL